MKMRSNVFALVMALVMAVSFGACTSKTPNSAAPDDNVSSGQQSEVPSPTPDTQPQVKENFNPTGFPIVDEKIELDVLWSIRTNDTYGDINQMQFIKDLESLTNIKANIELVKADTWNTKLNLMFASGDYVDVIITSTAAVDKEEYGVSQGLLLPVNDLIEQYMPNYKERVDGENPDILLGLKASDGNMYSIGWMNSQRVSSKPAFFLNRPWMEALQLEVPKTVDELTEVLRAFKTKDPNKNSKADELPWSAGFNTGDSSFRTAFSFWGIPLETDENYFIIDDNKQVQFAPYLPGFRETLEWIHMLYSEGMFDAEFISSGPMIEQTRNEGNSGFFSVWRLQQSGAISAWAVDNAMFIDPVVADGYKISMPRVPEVAQNGAYIVSTNKHIPETMRWLDAQLETEMMFTSMLGEEGKGWQYNADGKIKNIRDNTSATVMQSMDINAMYFAPPEYYSKIYEFPAHYQEKADYCDHYLEQGYVQKYTNRLLRYTSLTSDERARCNLLVTDINSAVKENMAEFITKGITDSSWNTFIAMFDKMHVDEYLEIQQRGLDKMQ